MADGEKRTLVGSAMLDELVSKGFSFDDGESVLAFMADELGRAVNVSDMFLARCQSSELADCFDTERFGQLFGDVMGRYMRNRLIIILPVLYVVAAITLIANAVGIRAVVGIRHKLPRHWVLMNLSLSDSLLAPLNAIKVTSEVLAYSAFDEFFRTYLNSVWQVFFLLCPLSLFFLAIDNVVAVAWPFFYERHSGSGARTIVLSLGAVTWFLIILLIALLHVFGVQHSQTVQLIVATVLLMIIAIAVTLYVALALKAEAYRRRLMVLALPTSVTNSDRQQRELLRSRMKTTATTLSIVLTLAGFWSPFIAYLLIPDTAKFARVPFYIKFLCSALTLFQVGTAIDPIVYCCRMLEVRRSLIASVLPESCRERHHSTKTPRPSMADSQIFQTQNGGGKRSSSSHATQISSTTPRSEATSPDENGSPGNGNGNGNGIASHKYTNYASHPELVDENIPLRQQSDT